MLIIIIIETNLAHDALSPHYLSRHIETELTLRLT